MLPRLLLISVLVMGVLSGCADTMGKGKIQKVGMLVENTVHDQAWGQKGYKGLLQIKEELDVDVYFKEHIQTKKATHKAVQEFSQKGVNLVFGHGSHFGQYFDEIQKAYPDIHFVYFNGNIKGENITSLNFSAHAMGFFGGMVAGGFSKTNHVGIIAAYEWQPEVEGFYEGVKYQNPNVDVTIRYVRSWDNKMRAKQIYNQMKSQNVDVYYPAGDSFSVPLIRQMNEDGFHAIGYVSDQSDIAPNTILTSTIQHVDRLYVQTAKQFNKGELKSGILTFDFQDNAITLGKFSPNIPEPLVDKVKSAVQQYKKTGQLPHEM
ncbi:BMP family ABC transporter substrate-binding protein [Pontibacillus sp. HMF3514]|nr:BMP family ABC transporter substrate-binding protein [Pontibacillus sp. HMF3514]